MTEFARRTARVILLDGSDRLLLIRSAVARGYAWFTPGGGVDDGEDLAEAAVRELQEETGLRVAAADLHPVAYTTGTAELGWAKGLFRDDFFLYRVVRHDVDTSGQTDFERRHYAGHRWWTHGDLLATGDIVYPNGLAALVADLIVGRIPETPTALPWLRRIEPYPPWLLPIRAFTALARRGRAALGSCAKALRNLLGGL